MQATYPFGQWAWGVVVPADLRMATRETVKRMDPDHAAVHLRHLSARYPSDPWPLLELGCLLSGDESTYSLAAACFFEAAKLRSPYALLFLGLHYATGRGVARSEERARRLMKLALESGVTEARQAMEKFKLPPEQQKRPPLGLVSSLPARYALSEGSWNGSPRPSFNAQRLEQRAVPGCQSFALTRSREGSSLSEGDYSLYLNR